MGGRGQPVRLLGGGPKGEIVALGINQQGVLESFSCELL